MSNSKNAFKFFCIDLRMQIKEQFPEKTGKEITKILIEIWGCMSEKSKKRYYRLEKESKMK